MRKFSIKKTEKSVKFSEYSMPRLASQASSVTDPQVMEILQKVTTPEFNIFELREATMGKEL